jgi:amicyanin
VLAAIAVVGLAACAPAAFRTAGHGTAAGATSASSSMPMPMPAGQMASAGPAMSTPPPPAVPAGAAEVGIVNFKFTPATVTIKVGGTIDWTNHDDIGHTVSFAGQGINSKVLQRNDRFSHTFDTPGTYTYICSIHPFMHGTVVVTA